MRAGRVAGPGRTAGGGARGAGGGGGGGPRPPRAGAAWLRQGGQVRGAGRERRSRVKVVLSSLAGAVRRPPSAMSAGRGGSGNNPSSGSPLRSLEWCVLPGGLGRYSEACA